mgnify:CR=1 FL=1
MIFINIYLLKKGMYIFKRVNDIKKHIESLKEKVKKIAAGSDLSLALGESGKVYGWG